MSSVLREMIVKAISKGNLEELLKLKEICDKLHDGQEVPGYTITDLPSDDVYENMCENDYKLGGEQSGHIIFKDYATTGDGVLTSLFILQVMKEEGKSLNELTDDLFIYPQLLVNVEVKDKNNVLNDPEIKAACDQVDEELMGDGRVLVRPSGTEPLIRVMVEASTDELCAYHVNRIVDLIKSKGL